MSYGSDYLEQIRDQLEAGSNCWRKGVNVLGAFGYTRRRQTAVDLINAELKRLGLFTEPTIDTSMPLDGSIHFYLLKTDGDNEGSADDEVPVSPSPVPPEADLQPASRFVEDPVEGLANRGSSPTDHTYTVANLEAAEREPLWITPDETLQRAITLMEMKNYSQLPVLAGSRSIKGLISYRSITRARLVGNPEFVRECVEPALTVELETPLLEVIAQFGTHDAVLVLGSDRTLSGIVTPSDIANEYGTMTGPFLLIGEIENLLRWLIREITIGEALGLDTEPDKDELTLGQVQRVLEHANCWSQLDLSYDQKAFCDGLNRVRETRNALMHFREPLTAQQRSELEGFARLVKQVCFGKRK